MQSISTAKAGMLAMTLTLAALQAAAQPAASAPPAAPAASAPQRKGYATPQETVAALVAALRDGDRRRMRELLGPPAERALHMGDAAPQHEAARQQFLDAYQHGWRIESEGDALAILHVGQDDWPFPYPLVKLDGRWYLDAKAGQREWRDRRVGANELAAIQAALAYVDAQRDYALKDRDHDGLLEYAQRLVSTPGHRDGLYWPTPAGAPASPLGLAFAGACQPASAGAAAQRPFHGYCFRILSAQGGAAPGGALDYLVRGQMIGGFGLIAYPARYGESGIRTFIVNQDASVYSKNLGPRSATLAAAVRSYDPDASWHKEER